MKLCVDSVGLSYGSAKVLDHVSFDLGPGSSCLLLGPSGSGKSSLLNIICGLQSPDVGSVTIDGQTLVQSGRGGAADTLRKKHMGIIFQTLRLVSALDVRGNLLLAQRLQKGATDPQFVDATLEQLGVAHRAKARPFELSQGEAQRAAIARALVVKPDILIADEPTSALDHANTQTVANLLTDAAQNAGATLLVATHDDRLKPYFDHTMTLQGGRLAA